MSKGDPAGTVDRTRTTMPLPSSLDPIAQNQLHQTMSGNFLNGAPANAFIDSQLNRVMPQLQGQFAQSGMADSTVANQAYAQQVADASGALFNNERQRQLQAAGMLPNVVGSQVTSSDPYFTNPLGEIGGLLGAGAGLLGLGGEGGLLSGIGDSISGGIGDSIGDLLGGGSGGIDISAGGLPPDFGQDLTSQFTDFSGNFDLGSLLDPTFNIGDALPSGLDFTSGAISPGDLSNLFGDVTSNFGGNVGDILGGGFTETGGFDFSSIGDLFGGDSTGGSSILGDLFGGGSGPIPSGPPSSGGIFDSVGDLFGGGGSSPPSVPSGGGITDSFSSFMPDFGGIGELFSGGNFAATPAFGTMMGLLGPGLVGLLASGFGQSVGGVHNPVTGEAAMNGDPIPSLGGDDQLSSTALTELTGFVDGSGKFSVTDTGGLTPVTITDPKLGPNMVEGFGQIHVPMALLSQSNPFGIPDLFVGKPAETNALGTGSSIERLLQVPALQLSAREREAVALEAQSGGG